MDKTNTQKNRTQKKHKKQIQVWTAIHSHTEKSHENKNKKPEYMTETLVKLNNVQTKHYEQKSLKDSIE